MASAKELIEKLIASGMSKAEISRRVGRNSSLVSQIEKGKKPGSNLVEPLQAMLEKRAVPKPIARLTKAGKPARVRRGKGKAAPSLRRDSRGRIKIAPPTSLPHVALRRLTEIAEAGGKVSIQVKLARIRLYHESEDRLNYTYTLYSNGGEYASRLLHDWSNNFLLELIRARPEVVSAEGVLSVGFLAIYTAAEARL